MENETIIKTKDLSVKYGDFTAIKNINLDFKKNKITALIGPSGCGKSTFLRSLNRMNDTVKGSKVSGEIIYRDIDISKETVNVHSIRKEVGMVFQKPNPFSKSIRENVLFPLKRQGIKDKKLLNERLEESLTQAALWDRVKDELDKSALSLSGGEQQRLCIARALILRPKLLLLDEPTSALDPISTAQIEATLHDLKKEYSMIIVTHNLGQASRLSDETVFFYLGEIVEYGQTKKIFTLPDKKQTEQYVSGQFG